MDELMFEAEQGAWRLAAVVTALRHAPGPLTEAAQAVLAAWGITTDDMTGSGATVEQLIARAAAPLVQAANVASGLGASWAQQSNEALLEQGRASAQAVRLFLELAASRTDVGARFAVPGGRVLDVGTGVGALALACAEAFPDVHVVGIDVSERVLALAQASVAASPAGARVELRRQNVVDLADDQLYDVAWVPAPFIPSAELGRGLQRVRASMRPGGWVLFAHGKFGVDPRDDAINHFKTAAFGGTALDHLEAEALLRRSGLVEVAHLRTPSAAPAIACARAV